MFEELQRRPQPLARFRALLLRPRGPDATKDPLRLARQFTARKPLLVTEAGVGALGTVIAVLSFADMGIVVWKIPLALSLGLAVFCYSLSRLATDTIRDEQTRITEELADAARRKVDEIHDVVMRDRDAHTADRHIQPQIIPTARFSQGYLDEEYQIQFGRDEKLMRPNSFLLLATFRNEPPSRPVKSLSASIIYHNNNPAGTGFWLRSTNQTVDLDIGCEQSVALIYAVPATLSGDGSAFMIIDERQAVTGKLAYVAFPHSLSNSAPPEKSITDTIGLTIAEAGRVLGTATYRVRYGTGRPEVMPVDWQPIKSNAGRTEQSDVILEQLLEEAALKREFHRLKAETPDVILELDATRVGPLNYDTPSISVFNSGSFAEDVRVDSIEAGDWIMRFYSEADKANILVPLIGNDILKFEPVPHIPSGDRIQIHYAIDSQSPVMKQAGLWWFIDCAMKHKEYEVMAELLGNGSEEERKVAEAAARHQAEKGEPLEKPIRITYGSRHNARRWERVELLHYYPDTRRAYISHGVPLEVTS